MSLFARAAKLIGVSSLFAVALLLHTSRDRTVQIWQSDPTVAWTRRTVDLGASDEPILHAALRSVVVRRDRLRPGYGAELVAGLAVYDDEGDRPGHDRRQYVRMSSREPALRYRGHLRDPTTGATLAVDGVRYRWTWSHEVVFDVADSFRWPDVGTVELLITLTHGDEDRTVVASFPIVLAPVATPTSMLAICTKPLYSDPTPESVSRIAQCAWPQASEADATGREHHALLGVDVVHLSARDAGWADIVAAWNKRSGRADTFTHLPALDPIAASHWAMHDQSVHSGKPPS